MSLLINKRRLAYMVQLKVASRKKLVNLCLKLRNQCNSIIGYHLGRNSHFDNGESLLMRALVSRSRVVFDVGANKGEWTESAIHCGVEAEVFYLFEPILHLNTQLKARFVSRKEIEVFLLGLSDFTGTADFDQDFENSEHSHIAYSNESLATKSPIKITTIDQICLERSIGKIDYLKIDCEGYDFHVIRGSRALLENKSIGFIQFEYGMNWQYAGSTLTAACIYLRNFGYSTYLIQANGLSLFDETKWGEFFQNANFLAVNSKRISTIAHLITK